MKNFIMNRESLKRHCEKMCKTFEDIPTSGVYTEHRFVLDLLEQTEWIPTSERYPTPDDEYKFFLVTDDKGKVSVQEFYLSLDEEPQPYFSGMMNVVAWMPLPKPYKPQKSEG